MLTASSNLVSHSLLVGTIGRFLTDVVKQVDPMKVYIFHPNCRRNQCISNRESNTGFRRAYSSYCLDHHHLGCDSGAQCFCGFDIW